MDTAKRLGERIKTARWAMNLSQRDLASQAGVSAMSISKYERGINTPSSDILLKIAQAVEKNVDYFLRPIDVTITSPSYRRRASLGKREERAIQARIKGLMERYLDLEDLLPSEEVTAFQLPSIDRHITNFEAVEEMVDDLRYAWDLGLDPIDNLTELLEDRGIKVGLIDGFDDFDACTFWANEKIPVIVVKRGVPGDRQRFNLAHELGHLVVEADQNIDEEKAAYRFAGAFLAPRAAVYHELGHRREHLNIYELHELKHKYGLSMQAWIYRAKELGILSDSRAGQLFREFRVRRWHVEEPGQAYPTERPTRFERLLMRAWSEELISEKRAADLLGKSLEEFRKTVEEEYEGLPIALRHSQKSVD